MDNVELIDNLTESLGNINASRQAHQQIIQILQSYKQGIQKERQNQTGTGTTSDAGVEAITTGEEE